MSAKYCVGCGVEIYRRDCDNQHRWDGRKYCSKSCANSKNNLPTIPIVIMWNHGYSLKDIADTYGVCGHTIKDRLLVAGINVTEHKQVVTMKKILNTIDKDENGCWNWVGYVNQFGYGLVTYDGRLQVASRISYLVFVGEFDRSLDVCHKCDNRKCVNPAHLFTGTRQENMDDARRKMRVARGSKLPHAKLTETEVFNIKEMLKNGIMLKDIATKFSVSISCVSAIKTGRNWAE